MRSWSEPKSTWPAFTWQQAVYTKNASEYDEFMHADRKMNTYTVKACSDGSMVRDVFHSTPFFFGFIGQLMFVTIDNINFKIRSKSVYFESWYCLLELTPLLTLWWLFWHCLSMTSGYSSAIFACDQAGVSGRKQGWKSKIWWRDVLPLANIMIYIYN